MRNKILKVCDYICDYNKAMIMASVINAKIEKYKGINEGKDVYVVGGGPSVKQFDHSKSESDIYIGVNRVFRDDRFEFDYLFVQDQLKEGLNDLLAYRGSECTKFLAVIPENASFRIREFELKGEYERYVLASRRMKEVPVDISLEPLADLRGTVFSALQFAIYTNPRKIYLVGMDCSNIANVYNDNDDDYRYQMEGWKMIRDYMKNMGVYDRVASINPVGLKGMFEDIESK